MPAPLYDAHIHLADPALASHWPEIELSYRQIGLQQAVAVGTCPADWPAVLELARAHTQLIPAIGLHPWQVNAAPADWKAQFVHALNSGAQAIGEIGLDKWIEGHDIERQQDAFRFQMAEAAQRNLPVSIHCLKAIGPLMETLRNIELPPRGIHLHAFNGPLELIQELTQLGTYFSFNAGQLKAAKTKVPERIRAIPLERILIETDAPDFLPPPELGEFELPAPDSQACHPGNLRRGYEAIAHIRGISFEALAKQVEGNFIRLFQTT